MTTAESGPPQTAQDMADLVAAETTAGERVPVEPANAAERQVDRGSAGPTPALLQDQDDAPGRAGSER